MSEEFSPPVVPIDSNLDSTPESKDNTRNIVLIVVAVILVLCCCCVGFVLLFYFVLGDMLLNMLDIQVRIPALLSML